jgi:hypothetical protein
MASTSFVPTGGVWSRGRFRIVVRCCKRRRCGLHAWKTVRAIPILHHADQLSAVGDYPTDPQTLVWDTQAFGVWFHAEIIGVKRDDGDQGLPSNPVGHRSVEHVPPRSPSGSPQQNEVSVLFLGHADDFINHSAHSHHWVYASLTAWWNQGVELPARLLTQIAANELLIEPTPEAISTQIEHVAEEEGAPANAITADRRPLDHMEEEDDTFHRSGQFNARPDRRQRRFGKIRGHQNAGHHLLSLVLMALISGASRHHEPRRPHPIRLP